MEAWLIVVITISSGLIIFGVLMFMKTKKNRQDQQQNSLRIHPIVFSSGTKNTIPSTSSSNILNARDQRTQTYIVTGQVYQQSQVHSNSPQHFYSQQQHSTPTNQSIQQHMMQIQQFYPSSNNASKVNIHA